MLSCYVEGSEGELKMKINEFNIGVLFMNKYVDQEVICEDCSWMGMKRDVVIDRINGEIAYCCPNCMMYQISYFKGVKKLSILNLKVFLSLIRVFLFSYISFIKKSVNKGK